jgi:hypothetical protein
VNKLSKAIFVLFAVALVAIFGLTSPALAQGPTPENPSIVASGCTLTISFNDTNPPSASVSPAAVGTVYRVYIFDDGVLVFDQSQTVTVAGQLLTFVYNATFVGQLAPGVGVGIERDGVGTFYFDTVPFNPSGCGAAASSPGCQIVEGKYQGQLQEWKKLYWAADTGKAVSPETYIPPFKVVNIVEASPAGWYKITWACGTYYITDTGVTPNFQRFAKPYLAPSNVP